MAFITEKDYLNTVGNPDGIAEVTRFYHKVEEPVHAGGGGILGATDFTTDGGGASAALSDEVSTDTFVDLGVTIVDVWLNQSGEQGVKIPRADFTYTAATGIITGLEATKNYTAYGR